MQTTTELTTLTMMESLIQEAARRAINATSLPPALSPCVHRGGIVGEVVGGCGAHMPLLVCQVHGWCIRRPVRGVREFRSFDTNRDNQHQQNPGTFGVCATCMDHSNRRA